MKPFARFAAVAQLLLSGVCLAQMPQTATALIEASIANADANAKEAFSYTFHEDDASFVADTAGVPPRPTLPGSQWGISPVMVNAEYKWSVQYDVLFVEGIPYRRTLPPRITDASPPRGFLVRTLDSVDRCTICGPGTRE